ncbi:MAG TPA: glycosyl hydrolase family 28-related protein [Clostridia bacterium]|nr:glycosyl hydrolase family 28-related protein [Clostridia bacterium]HPO54351.1 glycosyl hydrolase family 28-related protein [Clostridia bacterium]
MKRRLICIITAVFMTVFFMFVLSACGDKNEGNALNMAVNVKDYGAVGDGVHDDTAAIQRALDDCRGTGGTIIIPDGVYPVSSCLIIYSNQTLLLGENTTIKRNSDVKYMLAVYTEWHYGRYNGTHNVTVIGGTWDGNKDINEKLTIFNTCHSRDILFERCTFINGNGWHYIEINSSRFVRVKDCVFDGRVFWGKNPDGYSELIQLDKAFGGYGPVYRNGKKMRYQNDSTACADIIIENNTFYCDGTPALGNHKKLSYHKRVYFRDNTVYGTASISGTARGYITFTRFVRGVEIYGNRFYAQNAGAPNVGITMHGRRKSSCLAYNNIFYGNFSEYFVGGITAEDNIFNT